MRKIPKARLTPNAFDFPHFLGCDEDILYLNDHFRPIYYAFGGYTYVRSEEVLIDAVRTLVSEDMLNCYLFKKK